MPSLSKAIVEYCVSRVAIPPSIADIVKSGFIDCVACIAAGRSDGAVAALQRYLAENGRRTTSPVTTLTDGLARAPADVALLDGTAAHVLDYDDVALASHPSAVLVPAILAVAQSMPACSGADVLRAYVVGYEVWAELYRRDPDALHQKGWHPSSTLGLVAATAAVINLSGLPTDLARHALGIACSRASGVTANFGSSTKPLHIGLAASEAVLAVQLARAGITAAEDALEHRSGLLHALSPAGRVDTGPTIHTGDGSHYLAKSGLSIKRYPVCYASHRALDGILQMAATPGFQTQHIRKVRIRIGDTQANMLRVDVPHTELQAKFALKFCLSVAAVKGKFGLSELDPELMKNPEVARVFSLIDVQEDTAKCDIFPWFSPADTVTIDLDTGATLASGPIRFARGNAHNPMSMDEIRNKYDDCLGGQEIIAGDRLYAGLIDLQAVGDIKAFVQGAVTQNAST